MFVKNALKENRGYSTIPMQLIRALGVQRGLTVHIEERRLKLYTQKCFLMV